MRGAPKPIATGGPLLTRGTRRRRERLSDLERNIDLGTWEDRRRAVRALLARPLIIDAGEDRTLLHRHREWLTLWFAHHVGWE